jgi:hypothetical protein
MIDCQTKRKCLQRQNIRKMRMQRRRRVLRIDEARRKITPLDH